MLKNTGERLILEESWNLMTTLEHLHRYHAVKELVEDKLVLDAACGTGYGSYILSEVAEKVYGIDISEEAIEYAKSHYNKENLTYSQMSITDIQFEDNYFDVIVSFETIEHITKEQQKQFLEQVLKKLKNTGYLIISTPNDQLMREISYGSYVNPYHLCEFNEEEYLEFLKKYFKHVKFYYQTVTESSAIVPKGIARNNGKIFSMTNSNSMGRYYIAICSNTEIEEMIDLESCFLPEPMNYFDERYFTRQSTIFIDEGNGFTGEKKIQSTYISKDNKSFELRFDFKDMDYIKNLRFDPCEYGAKITILLCESNVSDIHLVPYNSSGKEDTKDVFLTLDPIYIIESEHKNEIQYIYIKGEIEEIPEHIVLEYIEKKFMDIDVELEQRKELLEKFEEENNQLQMKLEYEIETSEKRNDNIKYLQNILLDRDIKVNELNLEIDKYKQDIHLLNIENSKSKQDIKVLQTKLIDNLNDIEVKKKECEYYKALYNDIVSSRFWRGKEKLKSILSSIDKVSRKTRNIIGRIEKKNLETDRLFQEYNWIYDIPIIQEEKPLVSIIVPNYNHEKYLRDRLESIYNQTYSNFEVILLDDCSTDNSREIINEYAKKYSNITRTIFNDVNGGKVFNQWNKGLEQANGKYIWIAESDDYCELNFLETLVPLLDDQAVMLAFARSDFMQDGKRIWTLEEYLSDIQEINWNNSFIASSYDIVNMAFARKNIIPNVSSAIFRNTGRLSKEIVEIWNELKLSGDWLFYLDIIKGGCISYCTNTTNYYRIHSNSTSLKIQQTPDYYIEFQKIAQYIVQNYKVNLEIFKTVEKDLIEHYKAIHHCTTEEANVIKQYYSIDTIKKYALDRKPIVLMAEYSLKLGGGETYPLYLANELKKQGINIAVLDFRMDSYESKVRNLLSPSIPLFEIDSLDNLYKILRHLSGDIIHSHHACVDGAIADWLNNNPLEYKHIITLHGMYESIDDGECKKLLERVTKSCKQFIYIADKNLTPFKKWGYDNKVDLIKMANGLPKVVDYSISRENLGIKDENFVLCLASRGIPEKGWYEAIEAIKLANLSSKREIHLIIVGDGEIRMELERNAPNFIHFVGTQSNVQNYFAIADAGFLPTRFSGESYPLVVIESLLCSKPVIATDIGEVKNQLLDESGQLAGILLTLCNEKLDIKEICKAILELSESDINYKIYQERTLYAAKKFDISKITQEYINIYNTML